MKAAPFWAGIEAIAHTLAYEAAIIGAGPVPVNRFAAIKVPALVLVGSESAARMPDAARTVADTLHYARDVEQVLIPHVGRYRLADLDARLLRSVFAQIAKTTNGRGQPQSASAMQHLRTTLRAALNLALKEGLIDCNPARHIEVSGYRKPDAQVWTDAR